MVRCDKKERSDAQGSKGVAGDLEEPVPRSVVVVTDYPLIRKGLFQQINSQPDLSICRRLDDPRDTLENVVTYRPDLLMILLLSQDHDVPSLIKEIHYQVPSLSILVSSYFDDVERAKKLLRVGANGLVHVDASVREILIAIRKTVAGKIYICSKLMAQLSDRYQELHHHSNMVTDGALSYREQKALEIIRAGKE